MRMCGLTNAHAPPARGTVNVFSSFSEVPLRISVSVQLLAQCTVLFS